jgi:hypothetical protein
VKSGPQEHDNIAELALAVFAAELARSSQDPAAFPAK